MASNTFASIAAATAGGWTLERTTKLDGTNVSRLKLKIVGQPGASGKEQSCDGEGATSGAADTVALANCNAWRLNRYGGDSTAANISTLQTPTTSGPSTQGVATVHGSLTKDKH